MFQVDSTFLTGWKVFSSLTVVFPIICFHLMEWADPNWWYERQERQYQQQQRQYEQQYNYYNGNYNYERRWWQGREGGWWDGGQYSWWGDDGPDGGASKFFLYIFSLLFFIALVLFGNAVIDRSNQRPLFIALRNHFGHSSDGNEGLLLSALFFFGIFCLFVSVMLFFSNVDFRGFMDGMDAGEDFWQPKQFLPQTFLLWAIFCLFYFNRLKTSLVATPPLVEMSDPENKPKETDKKVGVV